MNSAKCAIIHKRIWPLEQTKWTIDKQTLTSRICLLPWKQVDLGAFKGDILRITTQQKCLSGREPELIAIMAPWTWLHNNTDVQFHRTFSKYIPALRFPLKFTTSLIAEPSVHNVFKLFAYWVILYFFVAYRFFPQNQLLWKFCKENHQSAIQFGSRSDPNFCRAWSGSRLFQTVINGRH